MYRVALLNNTINQYHHGCELVIQRIEEMLMARGMIVHVSSYEGQDWSTSDEFINKLNECDCIVVNGEGTIHHGRPGGEALLKISDLAEVIGIPCFLINATYQDNPAYYKSYLSKFAGVYVREGLSYQELKKIGVNSKVVPDLTLSSNLSLERQVNPDRASFRTGATTDSSIVQIAESLYQFSLDHDLEFLPVLRSYKSENKKNPIEYLRIAKFEITNISYKLRDPGSYLARRNLYVKRRIGDYYDAISKVKFVISGRFHSDCFALLAGRPLLVIDGNSHKVRSMFHDIGLSGDRVISANCLGGNLLSHDLEYSEEEKVNITKYLQFAKEAAKECFDEIGALVTNH